MHGFGGLENNGEVVNFRLTPARGCGSGDSGTEFDMFSPSFRRLGSGRPVGGGYMSLPTEGLHSKVAVKASAAEQERDFSAHVCDEAHSRRPRTRALPSPLARVRIVGKRSWPTAPRAIFGTANVTLYSDRFTFVVGPAEVVLVVSSAPGPPNAERERRLLGLLYSRAEAHKL
jgi:hypothetical protein